MVAAAVTAVTVVVAADIDAVVVPAEDVVADAETEIGTEVAAEEFDPVETSEVTEAGIYPDDVAPEDAVDGGAPEDTVQELEFILE